MTALTIKTIWSAGDMASELDATMCKLTILVNRTNVTEYVAPSEMRGKFLDIPAYFLAEWMAENWWALLHEPKKDEEKDDAEYRYRHFLLSAQHGFAVPNLSIMPVGQAIHVFATPHYAQLAGVKFDRSATADAARSEIEGALSGFISSCVDVLLKHGFKNTPLQQAWKFVQETSPDQREFCQLAGALGLSPYNTDDEIADGIDRLVGILGGRAARDLCLASTPEALLRTLQATQDIASHIDSAPPANIAKLSDISLGGDNFHAPGWRRGLDAAKNVSREFGLNSDDANGADKMFDHLDIDPMEQADITWPLGNSRDAPPFNCLVSRDNSTARFAIVPEDEGQRRFAAARAIYLAWISEPKSRRLATAAVTRDQQASRQFAAEILVPREYLVKQASRNRISYDKAYDIAQKRRASSWVVFHQANNSGIQIGSI